jgi:uncharacterized protein (TIGR02118 family)
MYKLIILIEEPADRETFESGWPDFLHWAEQMPGLQREVTSRSTRQVYGRFQCWMIHELHFNSEKEALEAMRSPAGQTTARTLQSITYGRVSMFLAQHQEDTLENIQNSARTLGEDE